MITSLTQTAPQHATAEDDDGARAEILALRERLRDERSRPIVREIQTWALGQRVLPESSLGKAISYLLGLWTGLTRFLDDPRIPLDNNHTERGLRSIVLGRRNHYGSQVTAWDPRRRTVLQLDRIRQAQRR